MVKRTDWDEWWTKLYTGGGRPSPYGDDATTYQRAGAYLSGPGLVREWGCATTWGKRFVGAPYEGIDGAEAVESWGAKRADLRTYRPEEKSPKALMRHVLEHNWEWRDILSNFLDSFTDRAVVIFFLPPSDKEDFHTPAWSMDEAVPALTVNEADLMDILESSGCNVIREDVIGGECPPIDHEVMFFLEKAR